MPPTTTGTWSRPASRMRCFDFAHQRDVRAGEDRQADHMGVVSRAPWRRSRPGSGGCRHRSRPSRHRGPARRSARRRSSGHRGPACRRRSAAPAEPRRHRDRASARTSSAPPSRGAARPTPVGARYSPKTLAQARAPFAGGDAGLGAGDRGRHDVAAFSGGRARVRPAPSRPRSGRAPRARPRMRARALHLDRSATR